MNNNDSQRKQEAAQYLWDKARMYLKDDEIENIELVNYGIGVPNIGFQLYTYVNEMRYCAKELIMYPHQTCAEHRHPPVDGGEGKQETFRVRYGTVYLYVPGEPTEHPHAVIPEGYAQYLSNARHEIVLNQGDMYTLMPDTWHWFQSGDEGCIVSEFSSHSTDENDILSDPRIAAARRNEA